MIELEFSVRPLITKDQNPDIGMAAIDIKGINRYVINPDRTHVYTCVQGSVVFVLLQENEFVFKRLSAGDQIRIEPKTPYFDYSREGATLISVSKRAFDEDDVIVLPIPQDLLAKVESEFPLT